ncbi:MAG TPA: hypothetical protein VF587_13510 [Solirubrobacteraceae bacterium]
MGGALYGHELVSELPLERLRTGPVPRGRIVVRAASSPLPAPRGEPEIAVDDVFAVYRDGGRLTMRCDHTGTFAIDPEAAEIVAEPRAAADAAWEHRLACVAVPLMLAERGDLALHASAVAVDGRAVAFSAPSGTGKSTTAAALAERGYDVLAEDGCVVTAAETGEMLLWPGLRGVRLPGLFTAGGDGAAPLPLAAVALLGPRRGTAPHLEPVAPLDALTALMPNTMHALRASQAAAFRGAAALARSVPVFRATLPDDLAAAPDHAESLLRDVLARASDA